MTNKKIKLKVNGMHCQGCASKVVKGVASLDANASTDVNVESGIVHISFNAENVKTHDLKTAIINAGFQVESLELE
jgi:Cu+-exporting ATPase